METNKLEDVVSVELYDYEKFKATFDSQFYINVIRRFPDATFMEYLKILFRKTFTKLTELYEIRNTIIGKGEHNSDTYHDVTELINQVTAIGMFLDEKIQFEIGKEIEKEQQNKPIIKMKIDLSAPERLQLLWDLGFDDLPKVKGLTDKQYKDLMVTILNFNKRDIEGYINSQNASSGEIKYMITDKHKGKVKIYLANL